jgi:dynactin 1
LHEMDEELQENARESEIELREDIDLANGKNRELERAREVAFEVIADHESTIHKFRDLVNKVQDQNAELRSALEKKKPDATSAMEMIDFKKMLADTKAFSKGQLILKCPFGVFKSTKKPTKYFPGFLP